MYETKDSGISAIGKIPKSWKTPKIKYVADFLNGDRGKNYPSGNDLIDEGIIFLTSNNIHGVEIDFSREISKYISEERYQLLGGAKIKIGDIIYCLRGSIGNCSINLSENSGTIASSLVDIRPKKMLPKFLNYCLQSDVNFIQSQKYSTGSCAANLSAENVSNYYLPEPSLLEQKQISCYLDTKCAKLDIKIAKHNSIMQKLEEYRKSLISNAVTNGLNLQAEMKDSRLNWISQIPKHWNVTKLKFTVILRTTHTIEYNNYIGLENIESYTAKKIGASIRPTGVCLEYKKGDVLFGKLRPYLAKSYLAPNNGCCSTEFLVMIPQKLTSKYLTYLTLSKGFLDIVNNSTYGAKMPRANWDFVGNLFIPLPPITEQKEITKFLDAKCLFIHDILEKHRVILDKLSEYKKSLIYNAVTGKIDCRKESENA